MQAPRHLPVLFVLPLLAAGGCSLFSDPVALRQSGTIVVQPDRPFVVSFTAPRPVQVELRFENGGPGTLEFRESLPDSQMHTVTPSGQRMRVSDETDRIEWVLTSDDEAVATYTITSAGSGSLAVVPK